MSLSLSSPAAALMAAASERKMRTYFVLYPQLLYHMVLDTTLVRVFFLSFYPSTPSREDYVQPKLLFKTPFPI